MVYVLLSATDWPPSDEYTASPSHRSRSHDCLRQDNTLHHHPTCSGCEIKNINSHIFCWSLMLIKVLWNRKRALLLRAGSGPREKTAYIKYSPLFWVLKTSLWSSPWAEGVSSLDSVPEESWVATFPSLVSSAVSFGGGWCEWTWAEHTTAVSPAEGAACETRSNQDCLCLVSEEAELWDVIVLTGEESEPLASLGTAEE